MNILPTLYMRKYNILDFLFYMSKLNDFFYSIFIMSAHQPQTQGVSKVTRLFEKPVILKIFFI